MGTIEQFVAKHAELSNTSLKKFKALFTIKHFKKGEVISSVNKIHSKFYLLQNGIARSFIIDKKGNIRIRTIFTPVSVICSLPSLANKTPANASYDCVTDCVALEANFEKFLELSNNNLDIANLYNRILEFAYTRVENRLTSVATLDATDRYIELKEMAPDIEKQIPLYQIAAYLNITPIQLSRIRKSLYSK